MHYINNTVCTVCDPNNKPVQPKCYYCGKDGHYAKFCKKKLVNRLRGYTGKTEQKFWDTCKKLHKVPSGNLKVLLDSVEKNIGKYDLKIGKHKFLVLLEKYAKRLGSSTRCLKEIQSEMENVQQEIFKEVWNQPIDSLGFKVAEQMLDNTINAKKIEHTKVRSTRDTIQKEIDEKKELLEAREKEFQAVKQKVEGQLAQRKTLLEEKEKYEKQIQWPNESPEVVQLLSYKIEKVAGKILGLKVSTDELERVKNDVEKAKKEKGLALKKMTEFNKQVRENVKNPEVQRVVNGIAKLSRADDKRAAMQTAHKLKKKLNL